MHCLFLSIWRQPKFKCQLMRYKQFLYVQMKKIRSNDDLLELQNVALKIIPRVRFRPNTWVKLNLLTHRFFAVSHIVKGQHPSGYLKCNQYVNDQDDKTCFRFIVTICSVLKERENIISKTFNNDAYERHGPFLESTKHKNGNCNKENTNISKRCVVLRIIDKQNC